MITAILLFAAVALYILWALRRIRQRRKRRSPCVGCPLHRDGLCERERKRK